MNEPLQLSLDKEKLQNYLETLYKTAVTVVDIKRFLAPKKELKGLGYGAPLLIEVEVKGMRDKLVLHTVRPGKFGHERKSDRAQSILFDFDAFNKLPNHVPALGVGAFSLNNDLISLDGTGEFFLVTQYFSGRLFAEDLKDLIGGGTLTPETRERTLALATYLANIHAQKQDQPSLYRRCIRDLLGHGEGVMGLIDSYPASFKIASPERLRTIEKKLIDWRWRIKEKAYRLSQVHGDFHPWNILFDENNEFVLMDRSRNDFGEPADDVGALSINFIFFSLQTFGSLQENFHTLHEIFWDQYLKHSHDVELNSVIQPFHAWRALVLAHPDWYPHLEDDIREKLFVFIEQILDVEWFDPKQVNRYLGESP